MLNTTAKKSLAMVDDQIVEALKSYAAGSAPRWIGAAVSIVVETIMDELLSLKRAETFVRDALSSIFVEPHTV